MEDLCGAFGQGYDSFLDYEWAGYRNVGFDVACVIAGVPQFLFARPISDEEAEIFISAWQRHLALQHAGYFILDYCSIHPDEVPGDINALVSLARLDFEK